MRFSFPKDRHLRRSRDIKLVFDTGRKHVGRFLVLFAKRNDGQGLKAGFIVSKKIGKATQRNRVKRLMREAFRTQQALFDKDLWLIFLPRADVEEWEYAKVHEEIARFAERIRTKENPLCSPFSKGGG